MLLNNIKDIRTEALFNNGWKFCVIKEGEPLKEEAFLPVFLPHDWLIYDSKNLYADGVGYYKKVFSLDKKTGKSYLINFDGVYMDSTVYVNGSEAGVNRYGYSPFEYDITELLKNGDNEIRVEIRHFSPNSRWYSGAGIYRDVVFKEVNEKHISSDGVYVYSRPLDEKEIEGFKAEGCFKGLGDLSSVWLVTLEVELQGEDNGNGCKGCDDTAFSYDVEYLPASEENSKCICRNTDFSDIPASLKTDKKSEYAFKDITKLSDDKYRIELFINNAHVWDITRPDLYRLKLKALCEGSVFDAYETVFGLRTAVFTTDKGFFLNGRHIKINGVCEHHDLGLFGAAFNRDAMKRKFKMLKEMGVNAVRTSHNMPAKELLELADEMGILVDCEGFDMWKRPKTEFDYARFFEENYSKDIRTWVRRDRNHPSIIMWSIGNEIYDCHADESAPKLTKDMKETVEKYDHAHNGVVTHGSNFMAWEGARKCTDVLKLAGYNYGERLYDIQHAKHPDWMIYGSETASTVQSRGIYHFPLNVTSMADDDEQCSSLGNCSTSWGAPNTEYVITMDRDRVFSQGQFIWTGFDYIGEPTPYHTKNSYFGQIDTAGFPKDSFYIYKGSWTDPEKEPFVHIFPYWDFNEGELIDVRVATNCDRIELFFNGELTGSADIDHEKGKILVPGWQIPYKKGVIKAVGYLKGEKKAEKEICSFGDPVALCIKENYHGDNTAFFEISTVDENGVTVENSASRVFVEVENGELLGLDNGDSTDEENYKVSSRRLFSGKLLAAVSYGKDKGELKVKVSSEGLKSADITVDVSKPGVSYPEGFTEKVLFKKNIEELEKNRDLVKEVPVRNILIKCDENRAFNKDSREITVEAVLLPGNYSYSRIEWTAVNDKAVKTNIVKLTPFEEDGRHFCRLTALGDGSFRLRTLCYNGGRVAKVISFMKFTATGLGKAYIDPYSFISGSLYTDSLGDIGNGNEKGITTPRGEDSYFGFENVDFGDIGSDEITIPIFTLNDDEYSIGIWEGKPGLKDSTLLCDGKYKKKSIWNVYQPETYKLNKKLKGLTNLYFTADDKYHFKGFEFKKPDKAYETLSAMNRSRIYGDTFKEEGECITGIGNNVTIEFDDMDFGEKAPCRVIICGRSKLKNNSIHLKFDGAEGAKTELLEFEGSDEYTERSFDINGASGQNTVGFVFLPGCDFDLKYFKFIKENKKC